MITDKEKEVIYACIKHWTDNIHSKFLSGYKAYAGYPPRWQDGSFIKCTVYSCPMCKEYLYKDKNCNRCLFVRILGVKCSETGGRNFVENPTLETCLIFMNNFDKFLRS